MDLNKLISNLTQSGVAGGLAGGVAGGALTSALMSKKGRKHAKTALQVGGLAAIGGLAWKAYQSYREGQPGAGRQSAGRTPVVAPAESMGRERWQQLSHGAVGIDDASSTAGSRDLVLIRAMVAAANADGHINADERQRIFAEAEEMGLSGAEKALLFDELAQPARIDRVVEGVAGEELAVEVYAASSLVVDRTCAQGRMYLDALAQRLELPVPLVQQIHAQCAAAS